MRYALIALTLLLAACSNGGILLTPHKIEIRQGNFITPEMRARISVGMTRLQIQSALGTPMLSDPFHANRWDYVYRLEQSGAVVEQSRLTLYFDDETLTRIEEDPKVESKQ
ncbi:MAG: outer membrane protein assembly factor BamE [Nitrosomonadales bacterium]|nr:outer membrane protein assembly factor BamE [Nitrosomonadales bacterium]